MSSQERLRRTLKKYARDTSRRKSFLNVDLNAPPPTSETPSPEGTSVPPLTLLGTSVPPPLPPPPPPTPAAANAGVAASPINVEAIEDEDVQLLSSLRALPQARNWSRRSQPVTVVLDEVMELSTGTSVINVDDHLTRLPLNSFRRRRRLSPNRVIINCEAYENVEDDRNAKMKKAANSRIELEGVPKEPMFSCPICMNQMTDACSTVCGHVFCQVCIKQAFKAQEKCPTCRRKLKAKDVHRVFLPTAT